MNRESDNIKRESMKRQFGDLVSGIVFISLGVCDLFILWLTSDMRSGSTPTWAILILIIALPLGVFSIWQYLKKREYYFQQMLEEISPNKKSNDV